MSGTIQVVIVGRVGGEPETVITPSGVRFAKFSVAADVGSKGKGETIWVSVLAFSEGSIGLVEKFIEKGKQVVIFGKVLSNKGYTDRAGEVKANLSISMDNIQFVGGGQKAEAKDEPEEPSDFPF